MENDAEIAMRPELGEDATADKGPLNSNPPQARRRRPTKPRDNADSQSSAKAKPTFETNDLMRMLCSITARMAVPEDKLRAAVVGRSKNVEAWITGYNACDGAHSQREAALLAGLDEGAFSRAVARWARTGLLFKVGNPEVPFHLYPLASSSEMAEE